MNPQGPFNEDFGNDEEALRRFFLQAGLPIPDKSLHLDRHKLTDPPAHRPLRISSKWVWATVGVAALLGLFLTIPRIQSPVTQSAAAGAASSAHAAAKPLNLSSQQQQAVGIVRPYLQSQHETAGAVQWVREMPATAVNDLLGTTLAPSAHIFLVRVAGPLRDSEQIVFPALTFYVNVSGHRVITSSYGSINRQRARNIAIQWAHFHRKTRAINHPIILSVAKVSKKTVIQRAGWQRAIPAWLWMVTYRMNPQDTSQQAIYINPVTGWVMIWAA